MDEGMIPAVSPIHDVDSQSMHIRSRETPRNSIC